MKNQRFVRLTLGPHNTFNWPNESGVYIIRRAKSKGAATYVGMAGRLEVVPLAEPGAGGLYMW